MKAMPASDSLPPLREVVRKHALQAKKSLGQNFLFDLNLTGRIARAAGPFEEAAIVEIGPGPGGLTRALLAEGAVRAPFAGTIAARYVDVGAMIHRGAPLVRLIEDGELRVRFAPRAEKPEAKKR